MSTEAAVDPDPEDPIEYFLQDMTYHGKSDRTRAAYERILRRFEAFLQESGGSASVVEASHRDCMTWVHTLRQSDVADSTVATYASYLHRFYAYMSQIGSFESNPMALVVAEMDEGIDTNPSRREVTLPEMRQFLRAVTHPLDHAVIVTLLKTGIRVGELCNLDLPDLTLEYSTPIPAVPSGDALPRSQLDGRRPSLYVPPVPKAGHLPTHYELSESQQR